MDFKSIVIISPIYSVKNKKEHLVLENRLNQLFFKLKEANLYHGYDIKIIGVNGNDYDKNLDVFLKKDIWYKSYFRFLDGTKGCGLSHILALAYIYKQKQKEDVLILEDDADINKNFLELIPNEFPKEYDIISMSANAEVDALYDLQEKVEIENIKKIILPPEKGCFTLETYFINGKNAKRILNSILPLSEPIDKALLGNKGPSIRLNKYIFNPKLKASTQNNTFGSYRIALNKNKFKYKMEFINETATSHIYSSDIKFKLLVHTTMLESDTKYHTGLNFRLLKINSSINYNHLIKIIWPSVKSDLEEKEILVEINYNNIRKECFHIEKFELIVSYVNPLYEKETKSISRCFSVIE